MALNNAAFSLFVTVKGTFINVNRQILCKQITKSVLPMFKYVLAA